MPLQNSPRRISAHTRTALALSFALAALLTLFAPRALSAQDAAVATQTQSSQPPSNNTLRPSASVSGSIGWTRRRQRGREVVLGGAREAHDLVGAGCSGDVPAGRLSRIP